MTNEVVIKKYPNRRLYDTEQSCYVTLSHVANMVKDGRNIKVVDAKTNEDVTAFILTQIIMEEVRKNNSLLPVSLLHLIIRFGGDVLSEFFEKYLEQIIQSYLAYRKTMDEQFRIYLELGLDFSTMAEKTFKELSSFPTPFSTEAKSSATDNSEKND